MRTQVSHVICTCTAVLIAWYVYVVWVQQFSCMAELALDSQENSAGTFFPCIRIGSHGCSLKKFGDVINVVMTPTAVCRGQCKLPAGEMWCCNCASSCITYLWTQTWMGSTHVHLSIAFSPKLVIRSSGPRHWHVYCGQLAVMACGLAFRCACMGYTALCAWSRSILRPVTCLRRFEGPDQQLQELSASVGLFYPLIKV